MPLDVMRSNRLHTLRAALQQPNPEPVLLLAELMLELDQNRAHQISTLGVLATEHGHLRDQLAALQRDISAIQRKLNAR